MKISQYIFLTAMLFMATSFIHKDQNEYGKWLRFYGLQDEEFKQVRKELPMPDNWQMYDMANEEVQLYNNLFFYSEDSAYFLDLYSYSVMLNKDEKGTLTWGGGDPESKIQLIKTKSLSADMLFYFGTDEFAETAIWRNKFQFEIMGFKMANAIYTPTIWKFDLHRKTFTEFENKKTFNTRPESYIVEVRLKGIKMQ